MPPDATCKDKDAMKPVSTDSSKDKNMMKTASVEAAPHSQKNTGSSQSFKHFATRRLTRDEAWAMQDMLLEGLSRKDFQSRLHKAWKAEEGNLTKQRKARMDCCLEVQGPIIAKFGFEPSMGGLMESVVSFSDLSHDVEISLRSNHLVYLADPGLQKVQEKLEEAKVRILDGDGGPELCCIAVDLADDVRGIKSHISGRTDLAVLAQRLLLDGRDLWDRELLSTIVPPEGEVELVLVRRRADVVPWLESLQQDQTRKFTLLQLRNAPPELLTDRELMLPAVEHNSKALQHASGELKSDREVVLRAVTAFGKALQYAAPPLRGDEEVVLASVRRDGWALEFASPALKARREIVLAAVQQDGWALQFAAPAMQGDREVVMFAVQQEAWAYTDASEELKGDREVALATLRCNWEVLEAMPEEVQENREVVLAALAESGLALEFASQRLRGDREVAMAALRRDGEALKFATFELQRDPQVLTEAVWQNGMVLTFIAAEDQTLDVALAAAKNDIRALPFVDAKFMPDVCKILGCPLPTAGKAIPYIPEVRRVEENPLAKLKKHFRTLGLDETSEPESIRKRYRLLALENHPDKNPLDVDGAKNRFQLINSAYRILKEHISGL